jgi:hypothetical protein
MDIFDRIASDFVKEARIPSTKNINRSTGKPWTKKEVETAYKKWKHSQNLGKGGDLWSKYEGASTGSGKLNIERINKNLDEIEGILNEKAYTKGDKIKKFFGKKKKVEKVLGISRSTKGGDGDPKKKKLREDRKKNRQQGNNFGKKKPSRRKDLTQHNKKASYREASQRVANRYLAVRGLV